MSLNTAYTPLESLLLFQALRSDGISSHAVFNRISDQLKRLRIVRDDPSYDSGRLSPDALRELYLALLKEEAKKDVERQSERDARLTNGDASPGSRKRKAPSPNLPTVHEATQHAHLIPQLVTRLYARYREHAVRDIREHERKYAALAREIGEIEAGEWDERLERQQTTSRTQSPRPSSSGHPHPAVDKRHTLQTAKSTSGSPTPPGSGTVASSKPFKGKIGDVINHGQAQDESSHHRRNSSNTTLPPLSEMAPQSPRFGIPPKGSGSLSTQVPGQGFSHSPPSGHQSPYAPNQHAHPAQGSVASPHVQNSLSRPSSSPRPHLPPPSGMKLPPPSPVQHSASPNLRGPPMPNQQQYPQPPPHRLSTAPSQGAPPQMPPQSGYLQPQNYPDRRTSYPPPQGHPGYPGQAPHAGGYQLPPFSVDPHSAYQQQMPMPQQSPVHGQRPPPHHQQQPSAAAPLPSQSQRLAPPANSRIVSDIIAALATPPRQQRKAGFKRPTNLDLGTPLPSPQAEPLSPVLKRSEPGGRSTRSTRNRDVNSEPSVEPEAPPKSTKTRGQRKRDRSPHSVVSSVADESALRTRSHSVSTAAGAMPTSDDRPSSRGNVKIEPSTPAGFVEIPDAPQDLPSGSGRKTRKRRGTLQSQPQQPPLKKSRQRSTDRDFEDFATPPPRSNTVVATRNFHKISSTIMNDINSHKHASYFVNPVRDKDAPGYSEIIRQPQNLKAIRAAVNAGTKAVNTAASTQDSPSAIANADVVELERSADLCPPKAIVNAAQLEKEVLRMFANAVMFNPGEDGMVSDTKEMFEDVEANLRLWRGAEKEAGAGGEGEQSEREEGEGKGKRRKV